MRCPVRLLASAALPTAFLLSACGTGNETSDATEPAGPTPAPVQLGPVVTSLDAIEGFWLVERFGEFEPGWQNNVPWRNAYVQVGSEGLAYSIGCNHTNNPASLGEDGVLKDTGDGSRIQTLMGCPPDWEDRDSRFFGFFGTSPTVNRLGEDRLMLKSSAGELVLVTPEAWRLAHVPEQIGIEDRWVPRMAMRYEGWGHSGFGIGDDPGVITIGPDSVRWSECPDTPIAIRYSADGRLERTDGKPISCAAAARSTDNGKSQVMDILASNPAVIRTGAASISLVVGTGEKGRRLDLQTEDIILNPPPPPPLPEGMDRPPPPPNPPPPR